MKTLLVEDNPADVRLIREMLKELPAGTLQLQQVGRLDSATELLSQEAFDVVLLDLGLPDAQGMETLNLIQKASRSVPIVVLTGRDDERLAWEALRAGAQDYLVKGRTDSQLVRAIRYAVERKQAEEEVRRLNAELEQRVIERTEQLHTAYQELLKEIADRKQVEEALRQRERELRDLIENLPGMVFVALPGPSNAFVSRGWREYTGLSAEDTEGLGWQSVVHPEDLQRHMENWRACSATGEPFEDETRFRRAADGEYRWFLIRAVPLRDQTGNIVKWYGALTDIEDRNRLRQLEADLAHMNRVSMLGELAASLSHELKQPIAAAIINANTCVRWLARAEPDAQEAREAATRAVRDVNRAGEVIDRLRALYTKSSPVERELVDVNEVLREMIVLLRNEGNRYSISMRTEVAAELPKIRADRVQLQQVLMNLMLNAIEAMKDTAGELIVKSGLGPDGHLLISVSDTGVGLPAEKADQIFNAFFTTKPQGSGMGLAISRSIVESHGGRLWATANSGRGATFHFTLPSAAEEFPARATGT